MKAASSSIAAPRRPQWRLRPLALSLACIGLSPAGAQVAPLTLPGGASVAGGVVTVGTPGLVNGINTMGINQATNRAILNWTSFSIGSQAAVNVMQPSTSSVLLNRVTGDQASVIAGKLAANGHVYLVNPAGVTFSSTSQVSVGGLVASTLDIAGPDQTTRNATFMAGGVFNASTQRNELNFSGTSTAKVTVEQGASIGTSSPGGTVALVGANVSNAGTINVARGSVGLISGGDVVMVVDPIGDGLTTFRIAPTNKATQALAENTGNITADGGRIQMAASSVSDVSAVLVRQSGVLQARSIGSKNGEIVLGAGGSLVGEMQVGGTLDARGVEGAAGGTVTAVAGQLRVDGASIDVSGSQGGQAQLIGVSGFSMAPGASVRADATGANGDGGIVLVGSLGGAHVSGNLSARGTGSGAGGQIVTSGGTLEVTNQARVDASGGATGANGTWAVSASVDLNVTKAVPAYDSKNYPTGSSAVHADAIGGALGRGTDVVLSSAAKVVEGGVSDGLGVIFAPNTQVLKTEGVASTLTVNSSQSILMSSGSGIRSSAGALNVNLNADSKGKALPAELPIDNRIGDDGLRTGAIVLNGATIETAGGNVNFYGQSDPVSGRAIGLASGNTDEGMALIPIGGVSLTQSTVSTCAMGSEACTTGGNISLRGQGSSVQINDNTVFSSAGIDIKGSTLRTGNGTISMDGNGGLGSAGVRLSPAETQAGDIATSVRSNSGDVTIVGTTRARDGGGRLIVSGSGQGAGVAIDSASVQTGGNVRITGAGGQIDNVVVVDTDGESPIAGQVGTSITNTSITAGTGRSISVTGTAGTRGFVNNDGTLEPVTVDPSAVQILSGPNDTGLRTPGGQIRIDAQGGDVVLGLTSDAGSQTALSVGNANGAGGSIQVDGRNILLTGNGVEATLGMDATGVGQGGNVTLRAQAVNGLAGSGILAMDSNVTIDASSGSAVGNGGEVRLLGERSLYAYGNVAARGGSAGGNGGFVETSGGFAIPEGVTNNQDGFIGGGIRLAGLRVDASAPAGKAGNWLIDPVNVDIVNGVAAGSLTANPFVPLVSSVIQDGDINAALNGGTSVRITTGAVTSGAATDGDIHIRGGGYFVDPGNPSGPPIPGAANISYTANNGPVTFQLDAHRSVRTDAGTVIASSGAGGPLNVVFNAGANGADSVAAGGGQVSVSGNIYTNGGNVTMNGAWTNNSNLGSSIGFTSGVVIDTRAGNALVSPGVYTGGSDAAAGGNVSLTGRSVAPVSAGTTDAAVLINNARIATSTGNVDIFGSSTFNTGVRIDSNNVDAGIHTTSGNVRITGVGSYTPNSPALPGHGVVIGGGGFAAGNLPMVQTGSGNIEINGLRLAGGQATGGDGVYVGTRALITSTGGGNIAITGESQNPGGAGIRFANEVPITVLIPAGRVQGSGNVVLRASNDGTSDALVLGTGSQVSAAGVLNLRPGGVDLAGGPLDYTTTPVDRTGNPITVGGTAATGFAVSAAELGRLSAPTTVFGSNAHAADITVVGALDFGTSALTLQNGGGGNIVLQAPVNAGRLGLASAGNITQTAAAPITAGTLLASSTGGSVLLDQAANNVSASTLGGGAAGAFRYQDVDELRVGPVSVIGYDAAGNAPQLVSATSMAADTVFIRTLTGDLQLGTAVSSTSGADLVAAARFQNVGGGSLGGAPWRVWADTWVGETRGGIAGSAPLPNFYNCAYAGFCGVTITPGNHFIYRQQPDATVVVTNQTRPFGLPNLPFTYSVAGLILGDTGAGFSGTISSPGTSFSLPGHYPINGTFTSAEGYRVTVVPGDLFVTAALSRPLPDVLREIPQTWLYDRNIGQAPICLATGPLDGDRASQGNDVLAREWSRVRSRPNLLSCVDTERRNGCADF